MQYYVLDTKMCFHLQICSVNTPYGIALDILIAITKTNVNKTC